MTATLANLPNPTLVKIPGPPWAPISSRTLAEALNLDRGLLGVWRLRGIGPGALPPEWLRGRVNAYRGSAVLAWLAQRRGQQMDESEMWAAYLATELGVEVDRAQAGSIVKQLASAAGPLAYDGVRFTSRGWSRYLDDLGVF